MINAKIALKEYSLLYNAESLKFWGEVLDREWEKVVNYKLPAQTAGMLFDRQREGKKARRMRRHKSLPN